MQPLAEVLWSPLMSLCSIMSWSLLRPVEGFIDERLCNHLFLVLRLFCTIKSLSRTGQRVS
jgi:hypothetical protein